MELNPEVAGVRRFRGGMGLIKEYRLLTSDVSVGFTTENTRDTTAAGVDDGANGEPGRLIINPDASDEIVVRDGASALGPYGPGTRLRVFREGGGGCGPARERDPECVRADVRNGLLEPAQAEKLYSVAVSFKEGVWLVDQVRTDVLRRVA